MLGGHAAFLAAHCSVPSPWRRSSCSVRGLGLAVRGGPLSARASARPSACPALGAASSSPSRCPQALPGWAQESVFTNTIPTAPWAPRRCPEDVRPRAPGGGPGARLSAAEGTLSLACQRAGRRAPRLPASRPSGRPGGSGAQGGPLPSFPCPFYRMPSQKRLAVPGLGAQAPLRLSEGLPWQFGAGGLVAVLTRGALDIGSGRGHQERPAGLEVAGETS